MVMNPTTLTVPWLEANGVLGALAEIYDHREKALGPLMAIGLVSAELPGWTSVAPIDWWRIVCGQILASHGQSAIQSLLSYAADKNPGNAVLATAQERWSGGEVASRRPSSVTQIQILIDGETSDHSALIKVAQIQALAASLGLTMKLELSARGSIDVRFAFISDDEARRFVEVIQEKHPELRAALTGVHHPDYWMDPLYAEGPDQGRLILDHIRASTRVSEVARSVRAMYHDDFWPRGQAPVKAVVDAVAPNEFIGRRLNPDETLHEAGVRPHDTLRVHADAQAGAVDPFLHFEALALVHHQIHDFARAHPGVRVEANSSEVPNEYVLHFGAPSFSPGDPPLPIEHHEVLLRLDPDFPMVGPTAFWQHPIFHPNVAADSGVVCLGVLRESYRPGLHFGEVCQMLIDMAAFRNYVVHEGFNAEAAQWAVSPEGQAAIVARGGRSLLELYGTEVNRPIRFTVRRLDG